MATLTIRIPDTHRRVTRDSLDQSLAAGALKERRK